MVFGASVVSEAVVVTGVTVVSGVAVVNVGGAALAIPAAFVSCAVVPAHPPAIIADIISSVTAVYMTVVFL